MPPVGTKFRLVFISISVSIYFVSPTFVGFVNEKSPSQSLAVASGLGERVTKVSLKSENLKGSKTSLQQPFSRNFY